jgi:hypothetical protein
MQPGGSAQQQLQGPQHAQAVQQMQQGSQQGSQAGAGSSNSPFAMTPSSASSQITSATPVSPSPFSSVVTGISAPTATPSNPFAAATKEVPGQNNPYDAPRFLTNFDGKALFGGSKLNIIV